MKALRKWQQECVEAALKQYQTTSHFLCQATPGAGKSRVAAEIAHRLLLQDDVDLVLCFAPSCQVVEGLSATFSTILGRTFDGRLGSIGAATTYQGMDHQGDAFWQLLDAYRVFVVFDEIHHCAGQDPLLSNAWGQTILQRIQDRAAYTLALSGTPWRSDEKAIALARYSDPEGRLVCDYRYGLREAIAEQVCRSPRILLIDNGEIKLTERAGSDARVSHYSNIEDLLKDSPVTFEELLNQEALIQEVIELGCIRLKHIRQYTPNAGGLVVATNVRHAHNVAAVLRAHGEVSCVVTNRTPGAQAIINKFREGEGTWIVAVGMISEGTDIPRLQVCCYLSRIRTELHYRQVLGRILRRGGFSDDEAWLLVLAEPALQQFSRRIAEDLPDDLAVLTHTQLHKVEWPGESSNLNSDNHPIASIDITMLCDNEGYDKASIEGDWAQYDTYRVDFSSSYRTEILSVY